MSETNRFLSLWQAWRYYLLLYVALLLIEVGLMVGSVRVLEMTVGCRSSSVRTNSGSEEHRAENLGPIPPLKATLQVLSGQLNVVCNTICKSIIGIEIKLTII